MLKGAGPLRTTTNRFGITALPSLYVDSNQFFNMFPHGFTDLQHRSQVISVGPRYTAGLLCDTCNLIEVPTDRAHLSHRALESRHLLGRKRRQRPKMCPQ